MSLKLMEIIINLIKSFLGIKKKYIDPTEDDIMEEVLIPEEETVDLIIDRKIRNKYRKGWINKLRKSPPVEIVIHGTGGGRTIRGFLKWMWDGERSKNYYRGISLFHYVIGKDGKKVEVIDPDYWVMHSSSGRRWDKKTIGIEMINSSKSNRDPYTNEQYNALFNLIFGYLIPLYPSITRITSHRYNIIVRNNGRKLKQCPGVGFDWRKLDDALVKMDYEFRTDGNLRYDISLKVD